MEGGIIEGVEGRHGDSDVDILRFAGATDREERSAANEDEAIVEILGEEGHCSVESFKQCGLLTSSNDRHFEIGYEEFRRVVLFQQEISRL